MRIILTTGGTGGHIFPALAVADALMLREPAASLLFVGSLYGPEKRLAEKKGLPFYGLPVRGLLGRGFRAPLAAIIMLKASYDALSLLRKKKAEVVVGFGSYASFATLAAAALLRVPTVLHEQNAIAGTSNRIMGRFARAIAVSLPGTTGFDPKKCVLTGNPVRADICAAAGERKFGGRTLMVLGGSQGAHALNSFVVANLKRIAAKGIRLIHQTGEREYQTVRAEYVRLGLDVSQVQAFIDDMAAAYRKSDLVLCRSGASTVAELCISGLPAVLVPFPYAIHDHQRLNAEVMVRAGAGLLIDERELGEDALERIFALLEDETELSNMSARALSAAKADAADRVARLVLEQVQS